MIVYIDTVSQGEMWLEAQSVSHDAGGGYTKIKVNKERTNREFFWTAIRVMMIGDRTIIKDGKRQ